MSYCPTKVRRNEVHFIDPVPRQEIQEDPKGWGASLAKGTLAVLEQVFYWKKRFPNIYFSQGRIAKMCDLSREQVNRIFSKLEKDGIVSMLYRHKKTSMYKVSSFFTPEIRAKISHLFRVFPITLLLSIRPSTAVIEKMSHKIYQGNYIYIKSLSSPESIFTGARARETESDQEKIKKERERETTASSVRSGPVILGKQPRSNGEVVMKIYELKSVKLTEYGQMRLSAFPEEVVYEIDRRMLRMAQRPLKPWHYFVSSCKKYCEEKGLAIDWTKMQQLAGKHCMPDEGPFIDDSFVPVQNPIIPKRPAYGNQQGVYDAVSARSKAIEAAKIQAKENSRIKQEREKVQSDTVESEAAIAFRKMLGMNEDGTFINQQAETSAKKALLPDMSDNNRSENVMSKNPLSATFATASMLIGNSISKLQPSPPEPAPNALFEEPVDYYEDYESDPFGDRL